MTFGSPLALDPPFRFLETITLGEVMLALTTITTVLYTLRKVYPFIKRLVSLVDGLDGLPNLQQQVAQIHHEMTPNGGGSMKDAVRRIEDRQVHIVEDVKNLSDRFDRHIDH